MAPPVVGGEGLGCSRNEETGDALVIGAGPTAGTGMAPAAAIGVEVE